MFELQEDVSETAATYKLFTWEKKKAVVSLCFKAPNTAVVPNLNLTVTSLSS